MKKHFNKKLVETKEDIDEDFENCTKCQVYVYVYVEGDFKIRGHFHIAGKHRGSAHRDCSIKIKINHKFPIVSTIEGVMVHTLLCNDQANSILQ